MNQSCLNVNNMHPFDRYWLNHSKYPGCKLLEYYLFCDGLKEIKKNHGSEISRGGREGSRQMSAGFPMDIPVP